jgi:hypothetical protein
VQNSSRLIRYGLIAVLAATVMTVFTGIQVQMQMVTRGEDGSGSWLASFEWNAVIWYSWALVAPFAAILVSRYPIEKGAVLSRNMARQVALGLGFIVLHAMIAGAVMQIAPSAFYVPATFIGATVRLLCVQAHWGLMSFMIIVTLMHVSIYVQRAQAEAMGREELRTQAATAQLYALKRQMQPHFLFNALNALAAMLDEGSAAQRFTIRLADMLRILLQSGDRAVATVAEELVLVDAYLEIERARMGSRLRTDIQIDESVTDCQLPSFILQPLVENAIRHSISRTLEGGDLHVRATRDASQVRIEISNSCNESTADQGAPGGMRMTIPNCRRRLDLMYGGTARFDVGFVTRNLFRAAIILPVEPARILLPV